VKEARLQFESDRIETQRKVTNKGRELNKAKSTFPINSGEIIKLQNEIAALQRGLEALDELEAELFPA